jgi:hypothetical protein
LIGQTEHSAFGRPFSPSGRRSLYGITGGFEMIEIQGDESVDSELLAVDWMHVLPLADDVDSLLPG